MRVKVWADGREAPLNPFVSGLIANVVKGIVASLKVEEKERKKIEFRLQAGDVAGLEVDGKPISLQLTSGFARTIVGSTLRGLLQPLKGTADAQDVIIRVEEEKV